MEKRTFKTQYDEVELYGERNNGELITEPDQSLTVKEILYRFTNGLPLDVPIRNPHYDEDEDLNDLIPSSIPVDIDTVTDHINYSSTLPKRDNESNDDAIKEDIIPDRETDVSNAPQE